LNCAVTLAECYPPPRVDGVKRRCVDVKIS
jgi:hypothetical protein